MEWTEQQNEDLRKLCKYAPRKDIEKAFPDRKWGSIFMQANRLNLKRNHNRSPWSDKELKILIDAWATNKTRDMIEDLLPERTWTGISKKALVLGLKKLKIEKNLRKRSLN